MEKSHSIQKEANFQQYLTYQHFSPEKQFDSQVAVPLSFKHRDIRQILMHKN